MTTYTLDKIFNATADNDNSASGNDQKKPEKKWYFRVIFSEKTAAVPTQTEQAKKMFLHEVQNIAGASVQVGGRGSLIERTIRVIVPDILGPVADQVYSLEVRVRRQYRHVKLNLEVEQSAHNEPAAILIEHE